MSQTSTATRFRRISPGGLAAAMVLATCGCASENLPRVQRDFSETVQRDGRVILKVEVRYLGKAPGDKSTYRNSHDYRRIDTDFYEIAFTNLTEEELTIEGVRYRMKHGGVHGSTYSDADSIARTWGTNVIAPKSTLTRGNNMVWSKSADNEMIKTYLVRVGEQSAQIEVVVPLVYRR